MRKFLSRLAVVVVLLSPLAANAQDALLDQVAKHRQELHAVGELRDGRAP